MSLIHVKLGGTLKSYAGDSQGFDLEARDIREMLARLGEACPALKPVLDNGVAVAINGEIYRGAWFQPLEPDSEIFILPKLAGG